MAEHLKARTIFERVQNGTIEDFVPGVLFHPPSVALGSFMLLMVEEFLWDALLV